MSGVYRIIVELENIAEGDATSVAQEIWDRYADELDAKQDEFRIRIVRDGFALDWEPDQ